MSGRRFRIVPTLLALACLLPGAEVAWQGAPGDKPPAPWSVAATSPDAAVRWLDGELVVQAVPGRRALAACDLTVAEATDEMPLRVSAQVSATGTRPFADYPALVGLEWPGGASFAVGLGEDPHDRNEQRRGWVLWSSGGKSGVNHAESALFAGPCPAHLRLVVSAREVAAYASSDGWSWQRIAGLDRATLAAQGPPRRLVLGRGRVGDKPGFDADPPGDGRSKPCTYRFAALRVEQGAAELPASLIRTYAKQDSLEDTRQAIAAPGLVTSWRIQGPLPHSREAPPSELPADVLTQGEWKDHTTQERVLQLSRLLNGGAISQQYWATTSVQTAEDGPLRLLFDGLHGARVYVDGHLVALGDAERNEAEPDRQAASVFLRAGTHTVAMSVHSRWGGAAAVILRSENGDPRRRIALLQRLLIDFPDDADLAQTAPFEISRLWEGLGFARAAAEALAELPKRDSGEIGEQALVERARLLRNLRDEAAAAGEISELGRRWAEGSDHLAARVRTAQLWQRLDVPERALGALEEALKLPDLAAAVRMQLGIERARLRLRQNDDAACALELRAAADTLPERDPRRFDLLATALAREVAQGKGVAQRLAELAKLASSPLQFRRIAGLHGLRKDEDGRLAARRAAAGADTDGLDLPGVDAAEAIAAADAAGAVALYRQTLGRLGIAAPAGAQLPQLRATLVRGSLAERAAGRDMLAAGAAAAPERPTELKWKVAGPIASPNWRAYRKEPVDPANVDTGKPVEGKIPWREVPVECLNGDSIDFARLGSNPGQSVHLLYAECESASERTVMFTCGADDSLTFWLNGRRLYQDRIQRGLEPNSIVIPGQLLKGRNRILAMVYNGTGTSGFQCSLRSEGWPGSDVMAALRLLETADGRTRAQAILNGIWWGLVRSERRSEAAALMRAIVRAWPDNPDLQVGLCWQVISDQRWRGEPRAVAEAVTWYDALVADRRVDDGNTLRALQDNATDRLLDAGDFELALARLRRDSQVELDPIAYARLLGREADLWWRAGYPRLAAATFARARVQASGDQTLERDLERRLRVVRQIRGDLAAPNAPFDVTQLMRGAERALDANEFERAATEYQKLIENGREQPAAVAGGRLRGAAAWAAGRMRGSAKVLEAWRDRWEARARDQLARAADDPAAIERMLERFPVGFSGIEALIRLSEIYAARGWWDLCAGTCRRVFAEWGEGVPGRERLQARWDLARTRSRQTLRDPDPKVAAIRLGFEAERAGSALQPTWSARSTAAGLILSGPGELLLVDPVQGDVRWRAVSDGPWVATGRLDSQALPSSGVALGGGAVVARIERRGLAVDAYEQVDGRLRWSSSNLPELAGMTAIAQPTVASGRAFCLFADRNRCLMAALDLATGDLLWTTAIGSGLPRQPLTGGAEVILAGHAAAPCLAGRDLFVCTDAGLVAALDAGSGAILWLYPYPRTATSPREEATLRQLMTRQAGVIATDEKRVFVHPRDGLALIALDRTTGLPAWTCELSGARVFAGTAGGAEDRRLILQGASVRCLDAASGAQRWSWTPSLEDGELAGQPAIGATAVWVATTRGLVRLALADGSAQRLPAWKQLGVEGVPANLEISGEALVACGDGMAVVLRPEGTPVALTVPRQFPAGPLPATGAKLAKDGVPVAAWLLPGGEVSAILRPSDGKDTDGEAYAVVGDRLVRLDAAKGALLWSVPCPPVTALKVAGKLVMAFSGPSALAFERSTGARAWEIPLEASTVRRLLDPGNLPITHLGADGLLLWRTLESWWSLRSPEDGSIRARGAIDGRVVGGLTHAGKIHLAVLQAGGWSLVLEIRDARSGVLEETIPTAIEGVDWATSELLSDGSLVIAGPKGCVRWLPEQRKVQPLAINFQRVMTGLCDGNRLTIVGSHDQERFLGAVVDAASGKVLLRERLSDWDPSWRRWQSNIPRSVGTSIMRPINGRKGKSGILVSDAGGKEIAFVASFDGARRVWLTSATFAGHALWLARDMDSRHYACLIGADGTLIAESAIPGVDARSSVLPPVAVGGLVLYGTPRGLCGLLPRGTAPLVDPAMPVAAREMAGLAVGIRATPVILPILTPEPRVDGEGSDWKKPAAPIEITPAQGWREFDAGATPPGQSLRVRAACSDAGVHVLIQAPLGTTEIQVAAEVQGLHRADTEPPILLRLIVSDGRPQLRASGLRGQDETPAPQPSWRLALGVSGTTAEVTLPWRCLSPAGKDVRLDRLASRLALRLGALAILQDAAGRRGALEWGNGLSRGLREGELIRAGIESAAKK